jgi:hypothetical protein
MSDGKTTQTGEPDPQQAKARAALEYRIVFSDAASWRDWSRANADALSLQVRQSALSSLRARGIPAHPLGKRISPEEIWIDQAGEGDVIHLRESSANRAALEALRELSEREPAYARRRLKIFASGLLPRHVGQLRRKQPFLVTAEDLNGDEREPTPRFDLVLGCLSGTGRPALEEELSECAARIASHGRLLLSVPFAPDARKEETVTDRLTWSIVEELHREGFEDVDILWYASESRGILGAGCNGTFVVDARRKSLPESRLGQEGLGVIALIGLPRSGTTMLTALLAAHADIRAVYEPWNAERAKYDHLIASRQPDAFSAFDPFDLSVGEFCSEMGIAAGPKPWLLIKETTTVAEYADAIEALLCKPPRSSRYRLIWLVRAPFHVYLSDIEARQKWWGIPDIEHSREVFERWARRSLRFFRRLFQLSRRFDGLIVSYEALAGQTEPTLRSLMEQLGIEFQSGQLGYHKRIEKADIRGDWSLVNNPREVSSQSVIARQREFDALKDTISAVPEFELIERLSHWADRLAASAVIRASDADTDILNEIQRYLQQPRG